LTNRTAQIFATTDPIAERVRKIGGTTLRSIGQISHLQRVVDNDADYVTPLDMLAELREDNQQLAARMLECGEHRDLRPQACSKRGSMRRNGVPGFSSKLSV
jgi:starvation-inducible DNA-binding protein